MPTSDTFPDDGEPTNPHTMRYANMRSPARFMQPMHIVKRRGLDSPTKDSKKRAVSASPSKGRKAASPSPAKQRKRSGSPLPDKPRKRSGSPSPAKRTKTVREVDAVCIDDLTTAHETRRESGGSDGTIVATGKRTAKLVAKAEKSARGSSPMQLWAHPDEETSEIMEEDAGEVLRRFTE